MGRGAYLVLLAIVVGVIVITLYEVAEVVSHLLERVP